MYENIDIKELPNSEIEISGEIPVAATVPHRAAALRELNEKTSLPGFRSGHIPEEVLVRSVGDYALLERVAERAFNAMYPKLLEDKKLAPIARPEVTITKLAPGNAIGFKVKVALYPAFELPDYKTLAQEVLRTRKEETADVTDPEVEEVLKHFRPAAKEGEGEPAPLTDETVKTFGNFTSVADFRARIKADLQKQKERKIVEERRGAIAEKLFEKTTIPLPPVVIEGELEKMFAQFSADIERMGMKLPDYLEKVKKTEESLRKEWRPDAEKRAKLQFILHKIAEAEGLAPDPADLDREITHLTEHDKTVDPERARAYLTELMRNEKVLQFLESQK